MRTLACTLKPRSITASSSSGTVAAEGRRGAGVEWLLQDNLATLYGAASDNALAIRLSVFPALHTCATARFHRRLAPPFLPQRPLKSL